mgnify:CR=1 FL=1
MSVPKHRRTESKLEVQTKARELAKYTTTICANEKVFPKRDRWIVTNRRERCVMFKKMTTEELLQEERKRNMELLNKQSDLENALLELAEIVATEGVGEDG